MNKQDAIEFTQSIGQIAGGTWRIIALAKKQGVPQAMGLSTQEWVDKHLGGYTRMAIENRREVAIELANGGASTREIAEVLGVSHMTAARDAGVTNVTEPKKQAIENKEETETEDQMAVTNVTAPETEAIENKEEDKTEDNEGVQDWAAPAPAPPEPAITMDAMAAITLGGQKPVGAGNIALLHTGDEESYTPEEYIQAARLVMGSIDLDPASNDLAQKTIQAARFFTVKDDGLTKPWAGNVWLNPPYTARVINLFVGKLCQHFNAGEVTSAVLLTNNNTDTAWWHEAMQSAAAVCFTAGRVNFYKPNGGKSSPTNGQTFFYFGRHLDAFRREFAQHGMIMVRVDD